MYKVRKGTFISEGNGASYWTVGFKGDSRTLLESVQTSIQLQKNASQLTSRGRWVLWTTSPPRTGHMTQRLAPSGSQSCPPEWLVCYNEKRRMMNWIHTCTCTILITPILSTLTFYAKNHKCTNIYSKCTWVIPHHKALRQSPWKFIIWMTCCVLKFFYSHMYAGLLHTSNILIHTCRWSSMSDKGGLKVIWLPCSIKLNTEKHRQVCVKDKCYEGCFIQKFIGTCRTNRGYRFPVTVPATNCHGNQSCAIRSWAIRRQKTAAVIYSSMNCVSHRACGGWIARFLITMTITNYGNWFRETA